MSPKSSKLLVLFTILALFLAGCGGGEAATVEEAAPVLAEEAAPVEAPAEEVVEAPAEEVVVEVVEAAEFDLVAAVDSTFSALPDGYMSVGNLDAFKAVLETGEAVVIDVRTAKEYEEGHVPEAINIPLRTLAQNLALVPADKPVVVYCQSGHRAAMAVASLRMLGYDNARAFGASYKGWTEAEEPVSTDMVEAETFGAPEIAPELLAATDEFLSGIPEGFLAMGDIEKFNEAIDNGAFLVDVREVKEYEAGYIPGAINIPIRTLAQNLDQIPTDQPVFVYCKSGYRAALSTAALQVMGYTNVRAFPPSFDGWEAAGEPIAMTK